MDGKFYGSERFNPRLISTQIVVMQSAFYLCLVTVNSCVDLVIGTPQSLSQIFRYQDYTWYSSIAFSMWVTSLVMAVSLRYVVERVKKCLDFVATYHIFHLFITWLSSGFPTTFQWWLVNVVAAIVAVVLGEYICMQAEMKEIKLGSKGSRQGSPV